MWRMKYPMLRTAHRIRLVSYHISQRRNLKQAATLYQDLHGDLKQTATLCCYPQRGLKQAVTLCC